MTPFEVVAILLAGCAAGTINTIVGSGTLITFPTLLAFGIPPVTANVSNTVGLVPGSVSGVVGYRAELAGQRPRLVRLALGVAARRRARRRAAAVLPSEAFDAIVPALVALGVLLVVLGPRIQALGRRPGRGARRAARPRRRRGCGRPCWSPGVYGGYFGAAQGVLLMAILGIGVADTLQRHNATKNVLALLVNLVAALVFIAVADVDWAVAGLIAVGSVVGGQLGATVGRRLPPAVLRGVIVVVGVTALVTLLWP